MEAAVKIEPNALEERALRDRVVYVPVSAELAQKLELAEEGPVYVRLESDPSGHELVRQLVVRRLA